MLLRGDRLLLLTQEEADGTGRTEQGEWGPPEKAVRELDALSVFIFVCRARCMPVVVIVVSEWSVHVW